jgi:predicted XRE-type DNA-binding protein
MTKIIESTGNIYADLNRPDADELLVKAQLVFKIDQIIKAKKWNQQQAAEVMGITQPKLSKLLRGQFAGVSEAKLIECLTKLGRDVQIVVGRARKGATSGQVAVVFA